MNKKILIVVSLLFLSLPIYAQKDETKLPPEEFENYKQRIKQVISFLEFSLNALGSDSTSIDEKDQIISSSYLKIFRDDKVQVEDDLDEARKIYTYKNIQAYLRDVDYFFQRANFELSIQNITAGNDERNNLFFKVHIFRRLRGMGIDNDSINNLKERFIEISVEPKKKELKIVSIYTTKLNEEEELKKWWDDLSEEWKNILQKSGEVDSETAHLKELVKTESLDLSGKKELKDISPLNKLVKLKSLNLSGIQVQDISPLRSLIQLEYLNLNNVPVTSLASMAYCNKLKELHIDNTLITNLEDINYFPALTKLTINNLKLTSLNPISQLRNLRELQLSGVQVSDINEIKDLASLEILDFSKTRIDSIAAMRGLVNLTQLDISNTKVGDLSPLKDLKKLKILYANSSNVQVLSVLGKIQSLEKIYCDNTKVTKSEASAFMNSNPKCLVIYESGNLNEWWSKLDDDWKKVFRKYTEIADIPTKEQLATIPNIQSIDISGNKNIESLEPLKILKKLVDLKLNNTLVKDLTPINNQVFLKIVELSNTPVSSLQPLKDLPVLERINCDNCKVSEDEVKSFYQQKPSRIIVYRSTKLKEWWYNLPEEWKKVFMTNFRLKRELTEIEVQAITNADSINANGEKIANLEPLKELSSLRILIISNTQISNLEHLKSLAQLENIDCSNTPLSALTPIQDLKNLKVLNIQNTVVKELEPLKNLLNLQSLNCSGSKVKKLNSLEGSVSLKKLSFSNTKVRNLKPLKNLKNIDYLECFNTGLNKRKIEAFQKDHPGCRIVFY